MTSRSRVLTPAEYVRSRFDLREWHHNLDMVGNGGSERRHQGFNDSGAFTHCICFGAAYRAVEPLLAVVNEARALLDMPIDPDTVVVEEEEGVVEMDLTWRFLTAALDAVVYALDDQQRVPVPTEDDR